MRACCIHISPVFIYRAIFSLPHPSTLLNRAKSMGVLLMARNRHLHVPHSVLRDLPGCQRTIACDGYLQTWTANSSGPQCPLHSRPRSLALCQISLPGKDKEWKKCTVIQQLFVIEQLRSGVKLIVRNFENYFNIDRLTTYIIGGGLNR